MKSADDRIAVLERELADVKRLACWWCGRSPQSEPEIQLQRLNPKGLRGVFQCQHCVTECDEAHAAIRAAHAIIANAGPGWYACRELSQWLDQHAPAIRRASGEK